MANKFEQMSQEELKAELLKYEEDLEDLEDERSMLLGQSGQHISGATISEKYRILMDDAKNTIAQLKSLIK